MENTNAAGRSFRCYHINTDKTPDARYICRACGAKGYVSRWDARFVWEKPQTPQTPQK